MPRLTHKRAVVTGAARGIGLAIAEAFVREGAEVILTDINDEAGEAEAQRLGARYQRLDVREPADWQRLEEIASPIDILVNNAGITGLEEGSVHDAAGVSLDAFREVMRTNLEGTMLGCQYAMRAMATAGTGAIINVASRSGLVGIPGAAAYAASKAAVRNHTKTVALYCAEQGWAIRCNAINPAAVLTPMWEPMLGPEGPEREAAMAMITADTPLRRFAQPEEIGQVAVMLASDECAYMTGTDINVDGGLLAGSAASPAKAE
ncbi:MAG: SDR family oxidoreductase [Parvularculaceae bacterium]|nr:SDR family oxidoreductase [Parvularculaceae bacterium]